MATQSDNFNRASLGTTDPAGTTTYDGQGTWTISASTVLQSPATAQANVLIYNSGVANAIIEADILDGPASSYSGLCARWTDDDNYLSLQWDPSSGTITMVKRVATVETTVGSWTAAAPSAPFNLKWRLSGDDFLVYVDDVDLGAPDSGDRNDSFNNTATRHGTWHFGNGSAGGTFDNWLLDDDLTVYVTDSDSFSFTEGGTNLDMQVTDTFTATDAAGVSTDNSAQSHSDIFHFTEVESLVKNGILLLELPTYALIESPATFATILDYSEAYPDDEVRESGFDIDI